MKQITSRSDLSRPGLSTCWPALAIILCMTCMKGTLLAQPPAEPGVGGEMVELNFPNEVELKGLVDYASQRLGIRILYDEKINGKKVSIRAPGRIPAESLLGVVESALKMKDLALVDADVPGWKRIVETTKLAAIAPAGDAQEAIDKYGAATAVTQAFVLEHVDPQKADQVVKPFLTQPGANSIVLADQGVLIVTDYATNMFRIAKMVELVDRPRAEVVFEFLKVQHIESSALVQQVTTLLTAKAKAQGLGRTGETAVEIVDDPRTNQVAIIGPQGNVAEVKALARSLDVPLGVTTEAYALRYVSASRVDRLVKDLVDPLEIKRVYNSAVDTDGNLLIVTTTPEIHRRVAALRDSMDTSTEQARSPLRFYRLQNATVDEVLETILHMQEAREGLDSEAPAGSFPAAGIEALQREPRIMPMPPPPRDATSAAVPMEPLGLAQRQDRAGQLGLMPTGQLPGGARVSGDPSTNSIIVVADPEAQQFYSELIRWLDRRRPQVLIEAQIVAIDTTDDFTLGVELSRGVQDGNKRLLAFSSFGLSEVDALTGALQLIPGLGFNGTLVDPLVGDVVVRALATHTRARVLAAPKILVNDNMQGQLQSVLSVPFESVNSSQTVATTSLGGNQAAGTTINVTPHIYEGNHLQLEFSVEFSSFAGGSSSASLPPPQHIDKVESTVTMPDGHMVIVGGLQRRDQSCSSEGLPFFESIPLVKYLASTQTRKWTRTSLFVFIRPIILRDDKFKDLRCVSKSDLRNACLPGKYPRSQPLLIK